MRLTVTLMLLLKKMIDSEFSRFLLIGTINTGVGYLLYALFLQFFTFSVSYSFSFVFGVLLSYFLSSKFVFRVDMSLKKLFQFPLVYFLQYLLGLILMFFLIKIILIPALLAPLVVVAITTPITFLLSRIILKRTC